MFVFSIYANSENIVLKMMEFVGLVCNFMVLFPGFYVISIINIMLDLNAYV